MFRTFRNWLSRKNRPATQAKPRMMAYRKFGLQMELLEQRDVPATILGWDTSTQTTTAQATPLVPTVIDTGVTSVIGITRGSGLSPAGAGAAYGSNNFTVGAASLSDGVTANEFYTMGFTVSATEVDLTQIPAFNLRRSNTGPTTYQFQYSINSGAFVDIDVPRTIGATTSSAGNAQVAITLSSISALQDLTTGTAVTFRQVLWGATNTGGTEYFNDPPTASTDLDFSIDGTVTGVSAGTLQYSAPTYTTTETGTPTATITVTRTGGSTGAAAVDWSVTGGTATGGGTDYTGAASGTLTWADADSAPKTFSFGIVDDALVEGPETVTLNLTGATGATLGTQVTATLTINDNDAGTPPPAGTLLINEVFFNPSGTDTPNEYVEIRNTTGSPVSLNNVYFVVVEGDNGAGGGGTADLVVDLTGQTIPANGFLVIKSSLSTLTFPGTTVVVNNPLFDSGTGAIENDSNTFMLVHSANPIVAATDYDAAPADGTLDAGTALASATLLDSVGVRDGDATDPIYGGGLIPRFSNVTPGGISRIVGNTALNSGNAWYGAVLSNATDLLQYNQAVALAGLPLGARATPGDTNYTVSAAGAIRFTAAGFAGNEGGNITVSAERIGGTTGAVSAIISANDLSAQFPGTESFRATNGTDYTGSPAAVSITNLTWSAGTVTVTATAHGLVAGDGVIIAGVGIPGYDGGYVVATVVDANTFTYALATNPGAAGSNGTAQKAFVLSWAAGEGGNKSFTIAAADDATVEGNEAFQIAIVGTTGGAAYAIQTANGIVNASDLGVAAPVVYLNEVKNDGAGDDAPNEYIELRGTPGQVLTNVYVVSVEGDSQRANLAATNGATWAGGVATFTLANDIGLSVGDVVVISGVTPSGYNGTFTIVTEPTATSFTVALAADPGGTGVGGTVAGPQANKPGTFDYVFDLSGFALGSNGLLIIRASTGVAVQDPATTVVTDPRFATAGGILENGTVSHLVVYSPTALVQATTPSGGAYELASDYDQDDNGSLEQLPAGAVLLDGVGVNDGGLGDISYGTFLTSGPTAFSPNGQYTRILESTTPFSVNGWRQGDPIFTPDSTILQYDYANANAPLGGGVTPGAANFSGVENPNGLFVFSAANYNIGEAGGTITITVQRIGGSTGAVSVQYATTNGTAIAPGDYTTATGTLNFADGELIKTFTVTILDDGTVEPREQFNVVLSAPTGGAALGSPAAATVTLFDNDGTAPTNVVLNELDVNPPSTDDPYEYVEIKGLPAGQLGNLFFVSIEGDAGTSLGFADLVQDLNGFGLGSSGLAVIRNTLSGFSIPGSTPVIGNPRFGLSGGVLENGTNSFVIIWSQSALIVQGADLDTNDDGVLDLPAGAVVIDAVGWADGGVGDLVYGGINLSPPAAAQGAATRFPTNTTQNSAAAWYYGQLSGAVSDSVTYSTTGASANLPSGAILTPGVANFDSAGAAGTLQFSVAGVEVVEGSTTVTITVTRVGGSTGAASVNYTTNDGTATQPGDYATASGTLNWADGDAASKTFTITLVNDTTAESAEELTVTLSGATGATLGTPATQTIRIYDNDNTPAVFLNEIDLNPPTSNDAPFEYIELRGTNGAALTNTYVIVLEAEAGTTTGQADLVFDLSTQSLGTNGLLIIKAATGGFTGIPSGTTIVTTTSLDGTGSAIENGSGAFIIVNSLTAITLGTDLDTNDDGLLDLPVGATLIDAVGFRDLTADKLYGGVQVTQSSGSPDGITRFLDNTAPFTTAAWYNGDLVDTGGGNASVLYSSTQASANLPVGASLTPGAANYATPAGGVISLSASTYTAAENAGTLTVTLRRLGGSTGAVSVTVNTANGTAAAPGDFTAVSGLVVNWADGDTADKTVTITIVDDLLVEGPETFTVALSSPTGGAILGTPATATVTITDNDSAATVLLNEVYLNPPTQADNAREYIEVRSISPSFALTGLFLLEIDGDTPGVINKVVDLSAFSTGTNSLLVAGSGYSGTTPWGALVPAATTKIDLTGVAGDIQNGSGTFLIVSAFTGAVGNDLDTDNDGVLNTTPWTTILDSVGISDGGANDRVYSPVALVNSLGGGTPDAMTRLVGDNDAFDPAAWYAGDIVGTGLDPDLGRAYSATQNSGNVPSGGQITPGDANTPAAPSAGTIQFSAATATVGEAAGTVTLTLTRTGGSAGAVSVTVNTANGTAVQPGDYTAVSGQVVNWADGDSADKTFTVTIANDTLDEANETFTATISNATGGATIGATATNTVTITDDDAAPTVQFTATSNSAAESVITRTLTVQLSAASGQTVTVPFTVSGTATGGGTDYTISPASPLSFAPGETSKTITITVVEDALTESNETVIATLDAPTNATLGTNTAFTETIVDNDGAANGTLQFSSSAYTTAEGQTFLTVTVTRTGGSSGAVSVDYATTAGTATQPGDYATATGTLNWANGDAASKTFTVAIVDDGSGEAAETFTVALSNATGGATIGAASTATVTVNDPILVVSSLTPTESGVVVNFNRAYTRATDNTGLNLYDGPTTPTSLGAPDVTLKFGTTVQVGSLVLSSANSVYFVRTGGVLTAASYDLTLVSSGKGFRDLAGVLLDGDNVGGAGGDYDPAGTEFTVAASTAPVVSVADFARGPTQLVQVPNTATGLPVTISSGTVGGNGMAAVDASVVYDPALLTITGMTTPVSGWTATINPNFANLPDGRRVARFTVNGPTALSGTNPVTIGFIQATVPSTAQYSAKQFLRVQDVILFDNVTTLDVPGRGEDAVHVSAYFGDANGSQTLTGGDAALVSQFAVGTSTGFPAYQLADPVIIADANLSGGLTGGDASLISQKAVGLTVPGIPDSGPTGNPVFGADPRLSIGDMTMSAGGTATMSLNFLATEAITPGLSSIQVSMSWNPNVFTYVGTPALGTYLNSLQGWSFGAQNIDNANGTARIVFITSNPQSTTPLNAGGQAFTFQLQVNPAAAPGNYKINLRENVSTTFTLAENNDGALLLVPQPTNNDTDTVDATFTVTPAATPTATVFIPNQNASAGSTITVPFNVTFNTATADDFASIQAAISWDPAVFQLTGTPTNGAFINGLPGWAAPTFNLNNTAGTLRIVTNTSNPSDIPAGTTGTAFVLSFTVAPTASGSAVFNVREFISTTPTLVEYLGGNAILPFAVAPTNGATDAGIDGIVTITLNPNDPPFNTIPTPQTYLTRPGAGGTQLVLSTANGNAIQVSDPDAGTSNLRVTLTVANGTLALGGTANLTVTGNGTGTVVATGPVADLNAALDGLVFTPTAGFYGTTNIVVNTNDLGNSGFGGATFDIDSVAVTPVGVFISEVFYDDGANGGTYGYGVNQNRPDEYVEIFSTLPNYTLPADLYFVGVEGDSGAAGNPGNVQDVFPLGGYATGSNGYLVLLQKANNYGGTVGTNLGVAANFTNTGTGGGWGVAGTSNIGGKQHQAANRIAPEITTDLENGSASYILVRAGVAPGTANDIDANDDGTPDGTVFSGWTVHDSVGVLDGNAGTDRAYGMITFRNGAAATAGLAPTAMNVVQVAFNPQYVARVAAFKDWNAADWVAARTAGGNSNYTLNGLSVSNGNYADRPLNHIGAPNYWTTTVNVAVNDGNMQRSQITRLVSMFTAAVDLPIGWQSKFALTVGSTSVNLILTPLDGTDNLDGSWSGVTQVLVQFASTAGATYTLANPDPTDTSPVPSAVALNDGVFLLTIDGTGILDAFGQVVDGNLDGTAGGTKSFTFARRFGDANGDGIVDNLDAPDYSNASLTYNGNLQANYLWFFDYNGDGLINGLDDDEFSIRYS